jgi:hypothetical protein
MSKNRTRIGRNQLCPCGSLRKHKYCHGRPHNRITEIKNYTDTGEAPVKWVISNNSGTAFFADKDGRIIIFSSKQLSLDIARLDLFKPHVENEINIAGVGPTKWQHLQDTLPYIEVDTRDNAILLIQDRIAARIATQSAAQ